MSDIADKSSSVMALCERHRSIELRQEELHGSLGDLEAELADRHSWFDLTRVQRRQLPAAQPFYDLEDELEQLGHESARLVVDLSFGLRVDEVLSRMNVRKTYRSMREAKLSDEHGGIHGH